MKVIKELKTHALEVVLTNKEVQTLISAQKIVVKIWGELGEADELNGNAEKIYAIIDGIGYCLETIANLVDIED